MELKTYFAQDAAGNIISSAIVNVFLQGTTTLATGLTRADGTPLENPFAADGAGRIQFRAPDGYYDVQVSAGPGIIQTLTIQCVDYSVAKDAAARAEDAADRADVSAEQVANALALRGEISDPDGAEKYPELQMARWRDEGDIRGWGGVGDGITDNTQSFRDAINDIPQSGSIYIPEGIFLITDTLLCDEKFVTFTGSGTASTFIRYSPSVTGGALFSFKHYSTTRLASSLSNFTITTDVPFVGTAVKIEDKLTNDDKQVKGQNDSLYLTQIRITQSGTGYWEKFLHSVNNGGMHLNKISFDNNISAAQTDSRVIGIHIDGTDSRVSTIRTLAMEDFYILRTAVGIQYDSVGARHSESSYFSTGEIVGCSVAGIKVNGAANSGCIVNVHFDMKNRVLDCTGSNLYLFRFIGCDFRRNNSTIPGPMFTLDKGEMITFSGCVFSGCNHLLASEQQNAFEILGNIHRWAISGCSFRNFYNIINDTPGCKVTLAGNAYSKIKAVLGGNPIDKDAAFQDLVISKSLTLKLTASTTQTVTVPVEAGYIEDAYAWPVAMLQQASGSGDDTLNIRYDFGNSSPTACNFIIKGNTVERTVRFSFIAMATSEQNPS